jgi:hypothetical protein
MPGASASLPAAREGRMKRGASPAAAPKAASLPVVDSKVRRETRIPLVIMFLPIRPLFPAPLGLIGYDEK